MKMQSWPALPARSREALLVWPALVIAASAVFSLSFACAVPLAAMAFIAARTMSLRTALWALTGAVVVNQAVGFLCLNYPRTLDCFMWGPFFVVATLVALFAARAVKQPVLSAAAAFAAFEATFALISLAVVHSLADYTPAIVGQVAVYDLVGVAVLGALYLVVATVGRSLVRGSALSHR